MERFVEGQWGEQKMIEAAPGNGAATSGETDTSAADIGTSRLRRGR